MARVESAVAEYFAELPEDLRARLELAGLLQDFAAFVGREARAQSSHEESLYLLLDYLMQLSPESRHTLAAAVPWDALNGPHEPAGLELWPEYQEAIKWSPRLDCDDIMAGLDAAPNELRALPFGHARRQLYTALACRRRALQMGCPDYELAYWLGIQRGSPLLDLCG